jgi:hypothetical protein
MSFAASRVLRSAAEGKMHQLHRQAGRNAKQYNFLKATLTDTGKF